MITMKETLSEAVQIMLDSISWKKPEGITTGYPEFDNLTRGLRKGDLTLLASLPSLGKTAFALNIVGNLMKRTPKIPILYYSALSHTELSFRLLTILSGVRCCYDHDLQGDESHRLSDTVSAIQDYPLFFEDSRTMDDVFFQNIASCQGKKHFGLIIMDPVSPVSLSPLKQLAHECEVPILALVSTEEKNGHIPGSEIAGTVIYLNRERKAAKAGKDTPVSFVVTRNRFGLSGTCRLNFIPQTMQFRTFDNEIEENT